MIYGSWMCTAGTGTLVAEKENVAHVKGPNEEAPLYKATVKLYPST